MLRLGNANAIVIQGLIAPRGLGGLKALDSWKFENKPEGGKTLVLRAPLVAIGAQKHQERTVKKDEFKFLLKETGQVLALLMAGHTKGVDRQ